MEDLGGRAAVVTGAASGIGLAIADRLAVEEMRLVLADVEEPPLREVEQRLRAEGHEVLAVVTDVSEWEDLAALERAATEALGNVHVLCNNAGVGTGGFTWNLTLDDWKWVLGVNLWGVILGCKAFVPGMIEHREPCHVVNTASVAGHLPLPGAGPYTVSKFGVVGFSETLHHELAMMADHVKVSVLCPGFVRTALGSSDRNRPSELADTAAVGPEGEMMRQMLESLLEAGTDPAEIGDHVVDAIRSERFWILPHEQFFATIQQRAESIATGQEPPTPSLG